MALEAGDCESDRPWFWFMISHAPGPNSPIDSTALDRILVSCRHTQTGIGQHHNRSNLVVGGARDKSALLLELS